MPGLVIIPAILNEPISSHKQEVVRMLICHWSWCLCGLQVEPRLVTLLSTELYFLHPVLFVTSLPLPNPLYTVTSLTKQGCLYQMRQTVVYGQFTAFSGDNFNRFFFFLPYVLNFDPNFWVRCNFARMVTQTMRTTWTIMMAGLHCLLSSATTVGTFYGLSSSSHHDSIHQI